MKHIIFDHFNFLAAHATMLCVGFVGLFHEHQEYDAAGWCPQIERRPAPKQRTRKARQWADFRHFLLLLLTVAATLAYGIYIGLRLGGCR